MHKHLAIHSSSPAARRALALTLGAIAALTLGGCGAADTATNNRGLESVHQPVVRFAHYLYDVQGNDGSAMTQAERARLLGWLDSLNVGYGDHIALATDDAYVSPALRDGIAEIVGGRGMLVEEDRTAAAGKAPPGAVRLILRRASASVGGCPNWKTTQETDMAAGVSSNFGCANNSNLAAMVASPEDLVRGVDSNSILRTATSNRAVKDYVARVPAEFKELGTKQ
jgi:pilus assembly protein CpaD